MSTKQDEPGNLSEIPYISEIMECPVSDPVSNRFIISTMSKGRILRNFLILAFAYFFYFSSFWSLSNLQSTMNSDQGMGVDSQAVIYLCSMASCFFPELLLDKFGSKRTYVLALALSVPYIAANFSLRWDTMMIASVLYGLVSGPLNAALTVYLDEMAIRFKAQVNESQENVEAFFFGFYMFFGELTQVLGNLISYYVLMKDHSPPPVNISVATECGVHFKPNSLNNTNLDPPPPHERYMVIGIFLALGLMGVFVATLLDPLKNDIKEVKGCSSVSRRITGAVRHLKNPHQLLLLPISIYCGIEGSFYSAEFTEAFIACSWGVHHVGFVTICLGVCGALMAILVGPLVKCISQMSVIILAALMNVVACALLFVWQPSPDTPIAYFLFAGVWGMTDAIWWSQIAALYGLMFPRDREAAFSNFFFWSFLGYFLSYSYANYFTVAVKISIMLVFLVVGITLYVIGQVKIKYFSARSGYVAKEDSE